MMSYKAAKATVDAMKKIIEGVVESNKDCPKEEAPSVVALLRAKLDRYDKAVHVMHQAANSKEEIDEADLSVENRIIFVETVEDFIIRLQVEKLAIVKTSVTSLDVSTSAPNYMSVKLPTLELDRFDGNKLKFTAFWSSFERRIDKRDMPIGDKFEYLKQSLEKEASRCVAGLIMNENNYEKAKEILKQRYGDPNVQREAHREAIMLLKPSSNDMASISENYFLIEEHLNNLQALGDKSTFEEFLPLVKTKFPSDVCVRIEESLRDDETLTLASFRSKLLRYINIREKNERQTPVKEESKSSTSQVPNWRRDSRADSPRYGFRNSITSPKNSSTVLTTHVSPSTHDRKPAAPCVYCGEWHWNDDCTKFVTIQDRKSKLFGRCFLCLSPRHDRNSCESEKSCFHCGQRKKHHRSLCPDYLRRFQTSVNAVSVENNEEADNVEPTLVTVVSANQNTFVPAASAYVSENVGSPKVPIKVILDTASQSTFITEELAKKLKMKVLGYIKLDLTCFGSKIPASTVCTYGDVCLFLNSGHITLSVIVVPHIANQIVNGWYYQEISRLKTKFPHIYINAPPKYGSFDILIGIDYFYKIAGGKNIEVGGGMYLAETKVGYVLVGSRQSTTNPGLCLLNNVTVTDKVSVCWPEKVDLTLLWSLEAMGLHTGINDDQAESVDLFNRSIKLVNNRYSVSWPWRHFPPPLPDNFNLSFYRLGSVVKQLKENAELSDYHTVINDQVATGIIEKVEGRAQTLEHYLPHLPVRRKDHVTTKLRVVFDASSRVRKHYKSLNDCLLKGPQLLEDLFNILLRFRVYPVVLLADIEKAFLQLQLGTEDDRNVCRFLWLKDIGKPCTLDNIQIYRFLRVAFGVISSPFLLNAVILHHLQNHLKTYPELNQLSKALYVDNLVLSVVNQETAVKVYRSAKQLFDGASMNLREWVSSSEQVEAQFEEKDKAKVDSLVNVLGLWWNPKEDKMSIKGPTAGVGKEASKRTVLQYIASVFDPFGVLAPTLLLGKLFLKKLWLENLEWDQKLSNSLYSEWYGIARIIADGVRQAKFDRCMNLQDNIDISLQCFADASIQAYHANVYLRIERANGSVDSYLVFSKNRVAPVNDKKNKRLTIPRLELLAICVGCQCIEVIRKAVGHLPATLWSDSQCALKWIKSNKILPVFEENRVKLIRDVRNLTCNYIPGELNPADFATRQIDSNDYLKSKIWWQGPEFLKNKINSWPSWDFEAYQVSEEDECPEAKVMVNVVQAESPPVKKPFITDISKHNDLNEFLMECWNESEPEENEEMNLNEVLLEWVKFYQRVHYGKELECERVRNKSKLKLWMDDGVLRCSSRLANAKLTDNAVYPILLPKNNMLTNLIIRDVHVRSKHVGSHHTLSILNQRFYLPRGLSQVYRIIRNCPECVRMSCGPYSLPDMPPLPKERVVRSLPFSHVGLDGLGPFMVKSGNQLVKVWVLLITCLATRAVYLGVMEDLTALQFLYVFREFVGRRTCPLTVVCDNEGAFKSVATVSKGMWWTILEDESVQSYSRSAVHTIQWKFIPSYSPFAGGVYERLVALVKSCIYRTVFNLVFTLAHFRVFIAEVQGILNSRPLCPIDDNGEYLTPNHLLNTPVLTAGPFIRGNASDLPTTSANVLMIWKRGMRVLDKFWQIWNERYLIFLTNRRQWRVKQGRIVSKKLPEVGDKVLISGMAARPKWLSGKIIILEGSRDGEIRSAVVETPTGQRYRRSISLLYPYEANVKDLCQLGEELTLEESDEGEKGSETVRPSTVELDREESRSEQDEESEEVERQIRGRAKKVRERRAPVEVMDGAPGSGSPSPPLLLSQPLLHEGENDGENEGEGNNDGKQLLVQEGGAVGEIEGDESLGVPERKIEN